VFTSTPRAEGEEVMTAIRQRILLTFLLALLSGGMATTGMAQSANDAAIRDVVRRIQTRTDSLQRAVQNASDRKNYPVNDINRLILDFETALVQLRNRLNSRQSSSGDTRDMHLAREVLVRGQSINTFMRKHRLGQAVDKDWAGVRDDLTLLAHGYKITWRW
jgi:hypothetical protein